MNKYRFVKETSIPYNNSLISFFQANKPKQEFSLLEIGCNVGHNLFELHNRYPNSKYYGIDIMQEAIEEAKNDCPWGEFVIADLEKDNLPYQKEQFDYIFCPDVLEHLTYPQKTLEKLRHFLKPGGAIYACIPNLMFYDIIKNLLEKGRFTYTETGLLDYDHKHFFTYYEILQTFSAAGYQKLSVYSIKFQNEISRDFIRKLSHISYLDGWQFESFQYVVKATL